MFKLILADLQEDLCKEFETEFFNFENVEIYNGRFEDTDFDCVVSAANSFGLMDGGVDGAITMLFGEQLMERVQYKIINDYYGEQPIGTSFIIRANELIDKKTGNLKRTQYVAHTPTMRIPMNISNTNNVYMAMKAMLIAVNKHNINCEIKDLNGELHSDIKIKTVVCTGLGTFCGEVPFKKAAMEMVKAYKHFLNPPSELDWNFAVQRHREIIMNK